jgi:hypothetical protein
MENKGVSMQFGPWYDPGRHRGVQNFHTWQTEPRDANYYVVILIGHDNVRILTWFLAHIPIQILKFSYG